MTATLIEPVETVEAALARQKAAIIDRAVRQARDRGWCEEFERSMGEMFPEGSGAPDGGWYDSDGWPCRGGYNIDGFNRNNRDRDDRDRDGLDRYGRDRDGRDREGYDLAGFNVEGVTREGWTRESPEYLARFMYDVHGFDRDGYNRRGRDPWGGVREAPETRYRFDEHGVAVNGRRGGVEQDRI